ncbi:hypothetical protein FRC09_008881 [Ceratobasidium sp. 395]|nr:hypothetical protein FRC09_008881 [Ceratobasidium sp. 395]
MNGRFEALRTSVTAPPNQPKQNKIEKAREWRIPIVNHLWLEDSFRAWAMMAISDRKYTEYPPGIDWMQQINARGIGTAPLPEPPRERKSIPAPAPAPPPLPMPAVEAARGSPNGSARPVLVEPRPSVENTPDSSSLKHKSSTINQDKPNSSKPSHASPNVPPSKPTKADATKRKHDADTSLSSKRARTSQGRHLDTVNDGKESGGSRSKAPNDPAQPSDGALPSSFAKDGSVPRNAFAVDLVSPERKNRRKSNRSSDDEGDEHNGSSSSDERNRPSLARASSSNELHTNNLGGRAPRAAATAAQDRLRNVVMPDVQKFQNEMQSSKGDVRKMEKRAEKQQRRASTARQDDDTPPAKKKKTQVEDADPKAKKPSSSKPSQGQAPSKKEQTKTKAGPNKTAPRTSDSQRKPQQEANSPSIRIICTKSKPTEKEMKGMTQLGVSFTEDPAACTHLVVNSIGRTEKFLCALPVCNHVVSMKWIQESIKAGKLLRESDYILKDPENEKKYQFNLAESIKRIKANGGNLFKGHTFYLTDNLGVDSKTLQRVIEASGGVAKVEPKPTEKKVGGDVKHHHVISSKESLSSWEKLKEKDIPVFNKEFILNGVLRQEVDLTKDRLN